MRHVYFLAFLFPFCFATPTAAQVVEYINANDVNAGIGIGANLFSVKDSTKLVDLYEVPKGTNERDFFTAALWMDAKDSSGDLICAAQQYNDAGVDFYDGPIATSYDSAYDNYYRRVFKITQTQIQADRALSFPESANAIDSALLLWPGKGNPFVASSFGVNINSKLAPFVDVDHDGIYNPMNGDYPAICGDEAIFFVFNDVRGPHLSTGSARALGVEVRGMAEEFTDTTSLQFSYSKRAVNNAVFVQYDIENKSLNNYDNFYLALWTDPDIGCFQNDYVGCDTVRNLMFAYNGTADDPSCSPEQGYGTLPIAAGVIMLNTPLHVFSYFTNQTGAQGDPVACEQYANYMSGYWSDGTPFSNGGTGFSSGGGQTNFVFPGDPNDSTQWSETQPMVAAVLLPGDRRMYGAISPATFHAGEIKHFDMAFTASYDPTSTYLKIIDTLKRDADIVQMFYNNNIVPCRNYIDTLLSISEISAANELFVSIYPNPANSQITIEANRRIDFLELTDMAGRIITERASNNSRVSLNVSDLSKGIYLLNIKCGSNWLVKKLVVE